MQTARRVILALSLVTMVLCSRFGPMDKSATQQVDAGLKRALVSYATARALNAVISVVQGTEISIQPVGLGVILTPGQLLEPVNDLIEDFSNLMLAASVAFGVQKVLISIGAYWIISLLLTIVAIGWLWLYLRKQQPPAWLSKILVILLMLRFAVPVVTIGSDLVFQEFMATDYETNQNAINIASSQTSQLNPPVQIASEIPGLIEQIKNWGKQNLDVKTRVENIKQSAELATEHIIKLIVIFLLQTLVIPLLLLWVLYAVARGAFERHIQVP